MEGIEIGKAISDYGIAIITGIFLALICWLVRYLITEILKMFKNELKVLHKDGVTNARLNRKSIRMIVALSEYLNKYFNGCADKVNFKKGINKANGRK